MDTGFRDSLAANSALAAEPEKSRAVIRTSDLRQACRRGRIKVDICRFGISDFSPWLLFSPALKLLLILKQKLSFE